MAKGGQRYKNMGKTATGTDARSKPAQNLTAKHVGATSRGGAMKKKTDYKRTSKHKGKMFEGVNFKAFMEMCGACSGGQEGHESPKSLEQKINDIQAALDHTDIDQSTKDMLRAMIDELSYEHEMAMDKPQDTAPVAEPY